MGRTSGGYTIVEVMIVLAISGVLLFSALTLVGGQQQKTGFTQAMQDVLSVFQNYASQIQAGNYPSLDGQSCHIASLGNPSGSRPQIGSPSSDSCVFFGRAFQVQPGSGTIYSYPILGTRTDSNGQSISSIDDPEANPEPVTTANLFDTYTLGGGATVVAANGSTSTDNIVGIYSQLEGSLNSSTGNPVLSLRIYPYPSNAAFGPGQSLTWCLEGLDQAGVDCTSPAASTKWTLCMTDGSQQAALEINANPSGLTPELNFSPAAGECG